MDKKTVEQLIDNTIMPILKKNNIFQNFMSVEEIRNKLIKAIKNVVYEDMKERGCVGYWSPSHNTIGIDEQLKGRLDYSKDALETIIHELLHVLTEKEERYNEELETTERLGGIQRNFEGKETGRGLNEGITEYLAQKLCPTHKGFYASKTILFNVSGSYKMEQIMIKQLAILYGEEIIIEAYLNNHDIDIPQEQYLELRANFDYISEKCSRVRDIRKGKSSKELSKEEQRKIEDIEEKIEDAFKESQRYFLEKCLMEEINKISTLEQAEIMKLKLRELNSFGINISNNEKANYKKYNFAFIRKYLQIVNKDKNIDEQVIFDDVERYLMGEEDNFSAVSNKLQEKKEELEDFKNQGLLNRIRVIFLEGTQDIINELKDVPIISSILNRIMARRKRNLKLPPASKKEEFVLVAGGSRGISYIKEIGLEIIAGEIISTYEFLTEEQHEQYRAGNTSIKGKILRGNIDLGRLKEDIDYELGVADKLLDQEVIEDSLMNCNGYIGSLGQGNKRCINAKVEKRLEETEKYVKVQLTGYEQEMYITEVQNTGSKDADNEEDNSKNLSRYIILTKDEIETRRRMGIAFKPPIVVQGKIDFEKLATDKKYREVLQNSLLAKSHIEERCKSFQGYVGEIVSSEQGYCLHSSEKYLKKFSSRGAKKETKLGRRNSNRISIER